MSPILVPMSAGAVALSLVASLAAQDGRQSNTSPSAVTVVGCLQRADRSGSLEGSRPGTAAAPEQAGIQANANEPAPGFLLTDATPLPGMPRPRESAGAGTQGAVGTSGSRDDGTAAKSEKSEKTSYVVEGNADQLTPLLGQRVELTGAVAPNGRDSLDPTIATHPGAAPSAKHPADTASDTAREGAFASGISRVRAWSVKSVGADCSPKG
jgi:hypothetical protein